MNPWRVSWPMAALALLSACAADPVELAGYCALDDPASEWVVGNKLAHQAERHCQGDYRILERKEVRLGMGHEYRWLIDCP
ncbi:MAG: hypothetical protein K2X44_07255 [Magnetospirillum sp.]|nr:hypothetical protein [Magnetospirillum sp.]